MKRILYIIGVMGIAGWPFSLQAQNTQPKDTLLNRTVVVEQAYNPNILDASKINVLPKVEQPTVVKKEVEYALGSVPATSLPFCLMQSFTGKEVQPSARQGYVRAGYGNNGNLDFLANYSLSLSARDQLNVQAEMDGMNAELDLPDGAGEWEAYFYRTRASLDYTHQFKHLDLGAGGRFGLSNFNFLLGQLGKQKFTSGDVYVSMASTNEKAPLHFRLATTFKMYQRQNNQPLLLNDALGETQVHTVGEVSGRIGEEQRIRIGLDMYNLFYDQETTTPAGNRVYENRTALALSPAYEWVNDSWRLRLGASVDLSLGAGETFRMSPDVEAQYIFSDSYVLYAKAVGGKRVNDFRRLEAVCPYVLPVAPVKDSYEQINASLGWKASPCSGLWFHVYGGYQHWKDEEYQLSEDTGLYWMHTDANNVYAGLKVNYDYKDFVSLSAAGTYRKWKADAQAALWLKPACEVNVETVFRPIPALQVKLGYEYIGREKVGEMGRLDPVSNLYAGADYRFFKGVSVYVRLQNLLNQDYQRYLGYPIPGFNFVGGLSFSF